MESLQHLQALSELLNPQQEQEDEDQEAWNPSAELGPGHIGPRPKKETPASSSICTSENIWTEEEVPEGSQLDDRNDARLQPEFEVIMRQSVGTEDVFLGLSGKDPSSMSCDALLVKVKLPDTKLADVVLDVRETFFDLRTPKYKLGLHLPQPVHRQEGKAQFCSQRNELEVTLPVKPLGLIHRT